MSRPYGGRLPEARSADRRGRLVQAGIELVGTHGVSALTMRAVCREAQLSQKFFYESFTDTEQLLHEVYRTTLDDARHVIGAAAAAATDRSARTAAGVDAAARLVRTDPRVCRILLMEPIADLRLRHFVRDFLADAFGRPRTETEVGPLRAKMHYATTIGAIISLFIEWSEGNLGEDRDAFVTYVTEMLMASPVAAANAGILAP
ncbi:helix-turn-helix domain-containing protein [[Mycobacterium] wendilense]|uniref:Helix-turn-helix domain-containing protein n=1 Tax=[Mycobacterium] wendilense TaxID=3064284 RepID=A0ABM9MFP2_9MYCO|nr:helix-turn-helix domain-containing protein [Mycolicibacterium sp. MU0050]CAJ1583990.1 helix-turn-helix domain-containing protein [Mycolicibacterium sp. MU0050]